VKILHCSDPHFDLSLRSIPLRKWFGKRAIGALNLLSGRGKYFNDADEKILKLADFTKANSIDLVICTGDLTALGLRAEIEDAKELIAPLIEATKEFIVLPGNHDIYAHDVIRSDDFNSFFGRYMKSDWPQYSVDEQWPFVRLFEDYLAVIGVNSAKPNPLPWRSDGYIPQIQLDALERILDDERLKNRWILVATHYASRLANGKADKKTHGLKNANEFLRVCKKIKKGAILNGHIHKCFYIPLKNDGLTISEYCAGSVSMENRECFWLFDISKDNFSVKRGKYIVGEYKLIEP